MSKFTKREALAILENNTFNDYSKDDKDLIVAALTAAVEDSETLNYNHNDDGDYYNSSSSWKDSGCTIDEDY